jgi:hypothetical protein
MKFMVEFQLKPGSKNRAMEIFEKTGPNRHPGVAFHGAWVGMRSDIVFVLTESDDESLLAEVAEMWREQGDFQIHPVIDVENF